MRFWCLAVIPLSLATGCGGSADSSELIALSTSELCTGFSSKVEEFAGPGMKVTRCGERFEDLVIELSDPVTWPVPLWNDFGAEALMLEVPVTLLASHVKETGRELGPYGQIVFGYPDQANFEIRFPRVNVQIMALATPGVAADSLQMAMAASEVGTSDGSHEAVIEALAALADEEDASGAAEVVTPQTSTSASSTTIATTPTSTVPTQADDPAQADEPTSTSPPTPRYSGESNERVLVALEWSEDTLEELNAQIREDLTAVHGYIVDLHSAPKSDREFYDGLHIARMALDARFNGWEDHLFDVRAARSWLDKVDRRGAQENLAHSLNEMAAHTDAWIAYYLALQAAAANWTYDELVQAGRGVVSIYTLPGAIAPVINSGYEQQQISTTFRAVCDSMQFASEQMPSETDIARRVSDMCRS